MTISISTSSTGDNITNMPKERKLHEKKFNRDKMMPTLQSCDVAKVQEYTKEVNGIQSSFKYTLKLKYDKYTLKF